MVRFWPNASGLEASRCAGIIWPGFWKDATGPLPVSHFPTRFCSSTDVPDNTVQNQPRSDLVLADCVRFWPNGSGPEASRCARIIRPTSGQCFPPDLDRMQIRSSVFTGEQIPLLWSTVGETALARGFCSNMGDMKYLCVCRRVKLPGRGEKSEK